VILEIRARLNNAIQARDADKVDSCLIAAYSLGIDESFVPALIELVVADWHFKHEDVALYLQRIGDARAIDALYEAAHARHKYLDFDEGFAFARKCTWALADIGTDHAKERLKYLSSGSNKKIAQFAQKRLDNWGNERARKKHT